MYLYPIFNAMDIKKSLPHFSKLFKQVDVHWKNYMSNIQKVKNNQIIEFCDNKELFAQLKEDVIALDKITRNLDN
jgi:hypothetical protein